MMKKILCRLWLLAILPCLVLPAFAVVQPQLALDSESAIVMCAETGQVLYAKNPDEILYPASITKILTGMVALKYGNLDDTITFSRTAYRSVPRDSAHIALKTGETLSMKDAMYALALVSANDAAAGIAETVGGSIDGFAELMNREAQAAGAKNSHFANPHGLPNQNHYTTARDMALITKAAIETPGFLEIFSTLEYTMAPTNKKEEMPLVSRNRFTDGLLDCPGLLFSKTGWTIAAQGTLVTAVRREGVTLIAVVMKSEILEQKYSDTMALFDYAYGCFLPNFLTVDTMSGLLQDAGLPGNYSCPSLETFPVLVPVAQHDAKLVLTPLADWRSLSEEEPLSCLVSAVSPDGEESFLLETALPLVYDPDWQPTEPPETEAPTEPAPIEESGHESFPWLMAAILFLSVYLTAVMIYIPLRRSKRSREL